MTKPWSLALAVVGGFMIVFGGLKAAFATNSQNCNRVMGCTSITNFPPPAPSTCNGAYDTPCSATASCQPCIGVPCLGQADSHSCVCTKDGGYLRADCYSCFIDDPQGNVIAVACVRANCALPDCDIVIDGTNFKAWCDCY